MASQASEASLPSDKKSVVIAGQQTDICVTAFSNLMFVIVTQYDKIGTLLKVTKDNPRDANSKATSVEILLGKRDELLIDVCGRRLGAHILAKSGHPEMILSLALKNHTPAALKEILAAIDELSVWS